jgi:hypothetical protein
MTRVSILGFSLLLATACAPTTAPFTNTLAQDFTWAAYQVCRTSTGTNIVVTQVHPDGRYSWIAPDRGTRVPEFEGCMREEIAKGPRRQAMTAAAPTPQVRMTITGPIAKPEWKVGSEWAYQYENPSEGGTSIWRLDRIENLVNEPHYVIKGGSRELFYRVADRGFTKEVLNGRTIREVSPSASLVAFPLRVGLLWDMKYSETRPPEQQTVNIERRCLAEREETLTVPAGTFATIRIDCWNSRTGAWVSTVWYSPEVIQNVKEEWALRTGGRTSRELLMFRLK